jgi:hypothetical protein
VAAIILTPFGTVEGPHYRPRSQGRFVIHFEANCVTQGREPRGLARQVSWVKPLYDRSLSWAYPLSNEFIPVLIETISPDPFRMFFDFFATNMKKIAAC